MFNLQISDSFMDMIWTYRRRIAGIGAATPMFATQQKDPARKVLLPVGA